MAATQHPLQPLTLNLLRHAHRDQNAFFQQIPETNLTTLGSTYAWEAKDHVVHLTFGRQALLNRVEATLRQKPEPPEEAGQSPESLFERQRLRTWTDILTESDRVFATMIACAEQMSEEELAAPSSSPLPSYVSFITNCYEHIPVHLAQYLAEHGEPAEAIPLYEAWNDKVLAATLPDLLRGILLYNRACFYTTHQRVSQAQAVLEEAFSFAPGMREFSLTDSDLEALRTS